MRWLLVFVMLLGGVQPVVADDKLSPAKAFEKHVKKQLVGFHSNTLKTSIKQDSHIHPLATEESWYLSGFVETERSEQFGYYFVVQRIESKFRYLTEIVDLQTGRVLLKKSETDTLKLEGRRGINFKIGNGFLRYNDINNTWIFGVEGEAGFNLRVESLTAGDYNISHLQSISFYTLQSRLVNGQVSLAGQTQFVTSNNAWLSHQWQDAKTESATLRRLLCRFTNNEGLMLVNAYKQDQTIFSLADRLDSHGASHPVSQFSLVDHTKDTQWKVRLISPKQTFIVVAQNAQRDELDAKYVDYYLGIVQFNSKIPLKGVCTVINEVRKPPVETVTS